MRPFINFTAGFRPRLGPVAFTLLLAVVLVSFYNRPLWSALLELYEPTPANLLLLASFALFLVAILNLLLSLVAVRFLLKPVAVLLLGGSAVAGHFMTSYGVMIDHTMIQNAAETHAAETLELLNGDLVLHLLLWGVLPALAVMRLRISYRPWPAELGRKAASAGVSLAVIALIALFLYQPYASLFRTQSHLRHLLTPTNFLYATTKYLASAAPAGGVVDPVGTDATRGAYWKDTTRKKLLVLVVGETARAENFSLNGYPRPTNPRLAQEEVINFGNVHSCGTSTAVSIPCMFSRLDREHYSDAAARRQEDLLDVLAHAGLNVLWRENNSGCKGVCDRVPHQSSVEFRDAAHCDDEGCFDEAMLNGLDDYLDRLDGDAVIVLHQLGSHGPAYYRRYPSQFAQYTPVCSSTQLQNCTPQEIVNAYDNTIAYTDYFLGRVIAFLKAHEAGYDTAMLYISDHGESLGEHNLYLHGVPYFFAPEEQKHVPFVAWLSPGYSEAFALDRTCLGTHRGDPLTHDHLFHSVLGLLDVQTAVYDPALDIFAGCHRPPQHRAARQPAAPASPAG